MALRVTVATVTAFEAGARGCDGNEYMPEKGGDETV
jgi:hypothetical protein